MPFAQERFKVKTPLAYTYECYINNLKGEWNTLVSVKHPGESTAIRNVVPLFPMEPDSQTASPGVAVVTLDNGLVAWFKESSAAEDWAAKKHPKNYVLVQYEILGRLGNDPNPTGSQKKVLSDEYLLSLCNSRGT